MSKEEIKLKRKSKDYFGNFLGRIKIEINVSTLELWMIRILLWSAYITMIIKVIEVFIK